MTGAAGQELKPLDVTGGSRVVGVFGCPVAHSVSPAMHNAAFASLGLPFVYVAFHVEPESLGRAVGALSALGMAGVNLTIPHKERALGMVDRLSAEAQAVGAVNTVAQEGGRLTGYNTDVEGFLQPLLAAGADPAGRQALVIGAGGAARAVVYALARQGAEVVIANRTEERAKALALWVSKAVPAAKLCRAIGLGATEELGDAASRADILVNCTNVGMAPRVEELLPVPEQALGPGMLVYDLVYNPLNTPLLRVARERGCLTLDGVQMLVRQGAAAFEIWTGAQAPIDVMERAVREALAAARSCMQRHPVL